MPVDHHAEANVDFSALQLYPNSLMVSGGADQSQRSEAENAVTLQRRHILVRIQSGYFSACRATLNFILK